MGRKAIMTKTIGIFKGKQAAHNKAILQTLYDYGPLSVWQITRKLTKHSKHSLHATLNKRIRDLEKKGYVAKLPNSPKWILNFKGFMTNLVLQKEFRPWSNEWKRIANSREGLEDLNVFDKWIEMANTAKRLLEEGVVNWDVIKNTTLAALIFAQINKNIYDDVLNGNIRDTDTFFTQF